MKPTLENYSSFALQFETTCVVSEDLIARVNTISPPDKDGDNFFADVYDNHVGFVWVISKGTKKKPGVYNIAFSFELSKRKRDLTNIASISELTNVLSNLSESYTFECRVGFDIKIGKDVKPLIYLPVKLADVSSMPFNVIQGVHLKKTITDGKEYDIFLEGIAKGQLYANIIFSVDNKFSSQLADQILTEAYEVVKVFAVKGESNARSATTKRPINKK